MYGYMNVEVLEKIIEIGEVYYWSCSCEVIWYKGVISGFVQYIVEMWIDDDQDLVWLRVNVVGNGVLCYVGYCFCFYWVVLIGSVDVVLKLFFIEIEKVFDLKDVYGDVLNLIKFQRYFV